MVYGYYTINGPSHCCHEEIEIDFDSGQIIWLISKKVNPNVRMVKILILVNYKLQKYDFW